MEWVKAELLDQHKHVLGLQDINVDMQAGEITVVMGLSGSGQIHIDPSPKPIDRTHRG